MAKEFQTIREIHAAYNAKKASPVEVTREYLNRVKQSKLNSYLAVCEERALAQAQQAEKVLMQNGSVDTAKHPLLGIPLGIKDVLTMDGVKTTCGSKILENYIPPYTSTAVSRLENAGAISLGKLNMDEFAMGSSNENSAYGPVIHPTHPDRVPGGSSGGSAVAVKAELCVASLGTDTGGSIRMPASFCGVVGFKPTYGRISRYGLIAFASSLDQIGPLSHTVEDSVKLLDVMAGSDPRDSTCSLKPKGNWVKSLEQQPDWKKLRIGIPKEYFQDGIHADVRKAIEDSLKWFESKGATLVPVTLPHTDSAVATYYVVAVSEASSNLARFDGVRFGTRPKAANESKDLIEFYQNVRSLFGPEVKRRIILGTYALSSGYYDAYYSQACKVRRLIKNDFDQAFEKVDFIAAPIAPTTAFKVGEKSKDPLSMYLMDIFTIPASLAGLPAMSIPCGMDKENLPIGLQLIGPQFEEERLIKVAQAFESR